MKFRATLLFLAFAIPAWAFGPTSEFCVQAVATAGIDVRKLTADAPDLDNAITQILAIQAKLWLSDRHAQPAPQGFLIGKWSAEEARRFIRESTVIVAESEGRILGFTRLASGRVFTEALRPGLDAIVAHRFRPDFDSLTYLQQIGVDPESARAGIGTALVSAAKQESPHGLFLAILALPFHNAASYAFFQKQGFAAIGFLDVNAYGALGDKRSHLMYWKGL